MQSIAYLCYPRIGFHRDVYNIFGLRVNPTELKTWERGTPIPLGDVGPALFHTTFGNVAARWIALELAYRKRRRLTTMPSTESRHSGNFRPETLKGLPRARAGSEMVIGEDPS